MKTKTKAAIRLAKAFVFVFVFRYRYGLDLVECLCKVFEDVVDVFRTNRETDCGRSDVLFGKLLR